MIYLASPYSDPDPSVCAQRYEAACAVAAAMLRAGQAVFSPIVHSHPLVAYGLPTDWAFWQRVDGDHLLLCDEVVVLMLDGWEQSVGVREEVRIARELGKPVRYVAPEGAVQPRAVSPTVAHVAAGRTEADVGPTNERTPRRGERGASGRREPLPGGVDRLPEPVPLGAGDHLVVPRLEERLRRGQEVGFASGVEFIGDRQQELDEVMQIDGGGTFPVVVPLLRDGGHRADGVCDRVHGPVPLLADGELTPVGLHEPGLRALLVDLPEDGAVQRGVRRLAAGAGPQPLRRHLFDHRLGVQRLLRTRQHLGRGVEGAQLPLALLRGLALRGLRCLGGLLRCRLLGRGLLRHLRSPSGWRPAVGMTPATDTAVTSTGGTHPLSSGWIPAVFGRSP